MTAFCRCGHDYDAHRHDHPRLYCSVCACPRWRRDWLNVLFRWFR
jgi:hypothetical protein